MGHLTCTTGSKVRDKESDKAKLLETKCILNVDRVTRRPQDAQINPCHHRIQEVSGKGGISSWFQVSEAFSIPLGIEEPDSLRPGNRNNADCVGSLAARLGGLRPGEKTPRRPRSDRLSWSRTANVWPDNLPQRSSVTDRAP